MFKTIKSCPFCGGKVEISELDRTHFKFRCNCCSSETVIEADEIYDGKSTHKERAIRRWNDRFLESMIIHIINECNDN